MKYLAFDIGCIECGEDSAVVGIYDTHDEAKAAISAYVDGSGSWGRAGWHGQHSVEVFEVTP